MVSPYRSESIDSYSSTYSPVPSTSATTLDQSSAWPVATDQAAATFTIITESTYQSKQLGSVSYYDEQEAICDCSFECGHCDEDSQCMNRLLQIECQPANCRAASNCKNQRFQNKEYANIDIVQTDKKGFGVRAGADLAGESFVYEYVGEVIGPTLFQKRIRDYATQGIKHFYFMALDRDVFIDATKKGGFGRFLNHSCSPNCVVAKWSVGNKQRMGIFTKRDVKKGEELTFNYNVDRYGHDPQRCFCGEANCVGWIGGKTQTDLGGMDQLYLDALGLNDQQLVDSIDNNKKKSKSKQLEEVSDSILLEPISLDQVPKVSAALRQAIQTKPILDKILGRIDHTTDESVQLALLRLHGFSLMKHILVEYETDYSLVRVVLSILLKWPLIVKNKVDASKIEPIVQSFTQASDSTVAELSSLLIDYWSTLSLGYRIPKQDSTAPKRSLDNHQIDQIAKRIKSQAPPTPTGITHPLKPVFIKPEATISSPGIQSPSLGTPPGWRTHRDGQGRVYYENGFTHQVQWTVPLTAAEPSSVGSAAVVSTTSGGLSRGLVDVSSIVAKVQREAEAAKKDHTPKVESPSSRPISRDKDKRVLQLFSSIVVSVMSQYRHEFSSEAFKRRAREVSDLLCDKERKQPTYSSSDYYKLSPDKVIKVKAFVKQFVQKLIERKRATTPTSTESINHSPQTNPS